MADEADLANDEHERHLAALLLNARHAAKQRELAAVGTCHNCEEPLAEGLRFCDADCRDDFAKRSAATRAARNLRADDPV